MKKILTVGAAIALALGFASCNKNESNTPDTPTNEGTTYMSVSFRLPAGMRAEDQSFNGIGTWKGQDDFKNVDVYLVTDGATSVERQTLTNVTTAKGAYQGPGTDGVYKTEAWKTTPGKKTVYVVVNNFGEVKTTLDNATVTDFADKYKKAYEMLDNGKVKDSYAKVESGKDIILMTGQPVELTVEDGKTKDEVENSITDLNKAKVTVRRVVSRVSVTMNAALNYSKDTGVEIKTTKGKVIGSLKDLSWTPMQYEQKSYLLWQDAPEYTVDKVKSVGYDYVPNKNFTTEAPKYYDYTRKSEALKIRTDFTRKNSQEDITYITGAENNMQFITETTHAYSAEKGKSGYKRGNTTYVMVSGTFVPDAGKWAEGEQAKYQAALGSNPTPSIYWGATTGKFYFEEKTALEKNPVSKEAAKAGKDGIIEFKAGKMYYFAWINPDVIDNLKWNNSPVVRNNIYHINISGFKNVGLYKNPYDPTDPNPDPDDPDPKDPDDPLYDKETYMVTEVTVINWGMHSYDVEF